jgi:hypothetical protein
MSTEECDHDERTAHAGERPCRKPRLMPDATQALAAKAKKAPATGLANGHAAASNRAVRDRPRATATNASRATASPKRNGICPTATGTIVPAVNTTAPTTAASLPQWARNSTYTHPAAVATLAAATPYEPTTAAIGENNKEYASTSCPPYHPGSPCSQAR